MLLHISGWLNAPGGGSSRGQLSIETRDSFAGVKESEIAWGPLVGAAMVGLILAFMGRALVPMVWERAQSLFYVRAPGQMLGCTVRLEGKRDLPVIELGYRYRHESIERVGDHWWAKRLFFQEGHHKQVCQRLLGQHDVDVWLDPSRSPDRPRLPPRSLDGHASAG